MRKAHNQIIFSASDLSNHIHCKHLTNLNYDVVEGLKEKPISNNKVLDVLRERGIDFENSFLIELESKKDYLVLGLKTDQSDFQDSNELSTKMHLSKPIDILIKENIGYYQNNNL